jgi:cytochrome P450
MDVFPSRDERLNPFSFYAKMRSHHHIEYDSKNEIWGIFRYSDSKEVLSNYKIFSSDIQRLTFLQNKKEKDKKRSKVKNKNDQDTYSENDQVQTVRPSILTLDPPLQRQLRNVISSAFTPNTIFNLKPRIEQTTNNLLDQVIERGQMDVIEI